MRVFFLGGGYNELVIFQLISMGKIALHNRFGADSHNDHGRGTN